MVPATSSKLWERSRGDAWVSELNSCFVDPLSKAKLSFDAERGVLCGESGAFNVEFGVVNFYERLGVGSITRSQSAPLEERCDKSIAPHSEDLAPELRSAHENAFSRTAESGGNIYGSVEDLPAVTQSGHFRRMSLLSEFDLGDIEQKIVVDFGTGPWGFAAIFPKLRKARACIGFDVALNALMLARKATPREIDRKTVYATSSGETIPLADDTVDIFFGGEVIEHVRNPFVFVQEISRVCKDGAVVILSTPNRDAFAYKNQMLQYCVGPEHIALLDFFEFRQVLESFFDRNEIQGFETSIGPNADHAPVTPEELGLLQERAKGFPQLASGLISYSRVSKLLYERNKRNLSLIEIPGDSERLHFSVAGKSLHLFDDVYGTLLAEDSEVGFRRKGHVTSILFWGHDWSGHVEVRSGEHGIVQDLYSPGGGFIRVDIERLPYSPDIRIIHLGQKRDEAKSDQVILCKILEYV